MIYLDYSATTPVNEAVLESFNKVSRGYIGNSNSLHKLGVASKRLMDQAVEQVADLLGVKASEVIFTSGASESNNLAILGVIQRYPKRGKHIITTKLEHSSVLETVKYLEGLGYIIDYVDIKENGQIDMEQFKKLLTNETVLVSIAEVASEVGILQNIREIGKILDNYPTTIFHVDGTQAIGKVPVSLDYVDLYSFSAHKFYGLKGIGCLIKKEGIELCPIIHGGKSQSVYRSGTPPLALIVSLAKALRLALDNLDDKYKEVEKLNKFLVFELSKNPSVIINSTVCSIPHIINISIPGIKAETMLHALEQKDIYISTKTACSKDSSASLSLLALNKSKEIATSSLRISISYLTRVDELSTFISVFNECYQSLNWR
ncbi:MAG: cysteine desulfurase family protein [Bacilli bacterium]